MKTGVGLSDTRPAKGLVDLFIFVSVFSPSNMVQDFLCSDCALRSKAKEGGNRLLYLWWSNMTDSMLPISLVLDTPARALPDKPTAGHKADVPLSLRAGPDSSEVVLRFRLKKHAAQRIWEGLSAHGY